MSETLPQRTHTLSCGECPKGCLLVALGDREVTYGNIAAEFGEQLDAAKRLKGGGRVPEAAVGKDVIEAFMVNTALAESAREAHIILARSPGLCRLTRPGTCQVAAQISTVPGRTGVFWAPQPNRRRTNR